MKSLFRLLIGVAFLCVGLNDILIVGLKVFTFTHGPLLGVFLLAALTKRGSDTGTIVALVLGMAIMACFNFSIWEKFGITVEIAWPWYFVIGALTTFAIGALFGPTNGTPETLRD